MLSDRGALCETHEALAAHRSRCEVLARDWQALLRDATCHATVALAHDALVEGLYPALPVSYPVLSTAARLDGVCMDCQRHIRDNLVRRV